MRFIAKKSVLLILSIIIIWCLSGCGANGQTENDLEEVSTNEQSANDPITLTLLTDFSDFTYMQLESYIQIWNDENPLTQIKVESIEKDKQYTTVQERQTSENGVDIIHIPSIWSGEWAESSLLAEAPLAVSADIHQNYPEGVVKAVSVDNVVFGYPTEVHAYGLLYHAGMLQDAGFDSAPKTWTEWLNTAKEISKSDGTGPSKTRGFAFQQGSPEVLANSVFSVMNTTGTSFFSSDKTSTNLESDDGILMMDFINKFYNDPISNIETNNTLGFASQAIAMTIHTDEYARTLKISMGSDYDQLKVAPVPAPDGLKPNALVSAKMWGVNRESVYQSQAWAFLKWLNTWIGKEGLTPVGTLLSNMNEISVRASDLETKQMQGILSKDIVLKGFVDLLDVAVPGPTPISLPAIQQSFAKKLEKMWLGEIAPDLAAEEATDEIDKILSN